MLPVVMFNMEGSSNAINTPNSNFSLAYDDNVILNCVRNRKKVTELPNCPVCSCTIRQGELETHLSLEVERLNKLSSGSSKRKLSSNSPSSNPMPGSSSTLDNQEDVDVSGCTGSDVYQRIHSNRLKRLRSRRRSPPPQQGECPVCNAMLPVTRLHRHALRCLKRTGAVVDEDVPDTSSEDGSIDVENDEPSSFGSEYQWCGEWRVRAAALQDGDARAGTSVRRASTDHALVVDGDEDTELYGPPQYSPSRIAQETDIPELEETSDKDIDDLQIKPNGLVEASAETRIQALKEKIKDLEKKQNSSLEAKCLICLGGYTSPAVSIQCWHVYCEVCWLQSLRAKKICPQCNAITTADHLRRIYISSSTLDNQEDVDVSGCTGSDVYQRIHSNRLKRLRSRRRSPPPQQGECPVCNAMLPVTRLHRHALRCLKRTGAVVDEDVPDTSSEDGSIDVENDEPSSFGSEYQWCGEWRVRAAALQDGDARAGTSVRRASTDHALVVDGDEDTELYGPPQYSPSRIAQETDIPELEETSDKDIDDLQIKPNGLVEASAETRIQALKEKIKDLEKKQNSSLEAKCLICLGGYTSPAVSIQCWHVYCEVCWLQSLRAKKICPQCNAITTADHLRRIYM